MKQRYCKTIESIKKSHKSFDADYHYTVSLKRIICLSMHQRILTKHFQEMNEWFPGQCEPQNISWFGL